MILLINGQDRLSYSYINFIEMVSTLNNVCHSMGDKNMADIYCEHIAVSFLFFFCVSYYTFCCIKCVVLELVILLSPKNKQNYKTCTSFKRSLFESGIKREQERSRKLVFRGEISNCRYMEEQNILLFHVISRQTYLHTTVQVRRGSYQHLMTTWCNFLIFL